MAWVWQYPVEDGDLVLDATIDYDASAPMAGHEHLSDVPINKAFLPVLRSRSSSKHFKKYHCPPMGAYKAIDKLWQSIILIYVPADRIQFLPMRLIARGEICDDFMWFIPFDRVRCIDLEKSDIRRKIIKGDLTMLFDVRKYVHKPNCLGRLHLARDEQQRGHLLVSNELRDALAETGESSMFIQPEDIERFPKA